MLVVKVFPDMHMLINEYRISLHKLVWGYKIISLQFDIIFVWLVIVKVFQGRTWSNRLYNYTIKQLCYKMMLD